MSINTELARIKGAKADLQSWVEKNGVTVPDGTLIDGLVELAKTVETGGVGSKMSAGTYTPTDDKAHKTVPHMLGVIPTFAFVCLLYGGHVYELIMLFQSELTRDIYHYYGNYVYQGTPLTSDASTEPRPYNIKAYGANESNISFGINTSNTSGYTVFEAGNTYQWIVGVTE